MMAHRVLLLGMAFGCMTTGNALVNAISTSTMSKGMAISLFAVSSLISPVLSDTTMEMDTVVTVISDLMSTEPETTPAATTPAPIICPTARWQVQNAEGDVCMLMTFNASISIRMDELERTVSYITETNSVANSVCRSDTSSFSVVFPADDMVWELVLNFADGEKEYIMEDAVIILHNASDAYVADIHIPGPFFTTPRGMYYTCDTVSIYGDEATVTLTAPIFQPFVHHTPGVCDLGEAFECPEEKSPNVGLIVGCTIGSLACVGTIGMTIYYLRKKKKADYTTF